MSNITDIKSISIKVLIKILDAIPYGMAIYDLQGNCLAENKAYVSLGSLRPTINSNEIHGTTYLPISYARTSDSPGWATIQRIDENLILSSLNSSENSAKSDVKAFHLMLDAVDKGYTLYQAAALALGLSTGWRWVGISQLIDSDKSVEILGFWNGNEVNDTFSYELAKTPCEKVFQNEEISEFSNVCDLFPEDTMLIDLGAVSYVGKTYKLVNQACGHVFMMSDKPEIVTPEIETFLVSIAEYIASRLEVIHHINQSSEAKKLAKTDTLTGLGNRLALEETVQLFVASHNKGKVDDILIVFIDLDGMKVVNDMHGHHQGDLLLQMFSTGLLNHCRADDRAFRIGGDEFIWVFKNPAYILPKYVREKMSSILLTIKQSGFPNADASLGMAYLAKNNWNFESALKQADNNMYLDKHSRKTLKRND